MLHRTYESQNCSMARALEVVGERWTILILRDAFMGVRRFDDFQRNLGVARNVLHTRLARLVDEGLLERRLYHERPPRYEYRLTERGRDAWPVLVTLLKWGDKHFADDGPPTLVRHRGCDGELTERMTCDRCGVPLTAHDVAVEPGPGAAGAAAA